MAAAFTAQRVSVRDAERRWGARRRERGTARVALDRAGRVGVTTVRLTARGSVFEVVAISFGLVSSVGGFRALTVLFLLAVAAVGLLAMLIIGAFCDARHVLCSLPRPPAKTRSLTRERHLPQHS
jgi:hypothetical protein